MTSRIAGHLYNPETPNGTSMKWLEHYLASFLIAEPQEAAPTRLNQWQNLF
jgi:hypothetical protein